MISDLEIGKAGEYLVCADLILKGFIAFPSDQGLPFDVVLVANNKMYKIQVKATRKPVLVAGSEKYSFTTSRRCGKNNHTTYRKGDIDIFAYVAIDSKSIGYIPENKVKSMMCFVPNGIVSNSKKDVFNKRLEMRQLKKDGLTYAEIARKFNLDPGYVHRAINKKESENKFCFTYLTDWKIEGCFIQA